MGRTLRDHVNNYFTNTPLGEFSEQGKEQLARLLLELVSEIVQNENPFAKFRQEIAAFASKYAELEVLLLLPTDTKDPFFASPYISCALRPYVRQSKHNKEIAEHIFEYPEDSDSKLLYFVSSRALIYQFYLNGLQGIRNEFEDCGSKKDWFRPLVKSMLIWQEDVHRSKLGLPRLCPGILVAVQHSTFFEIVYDGHVSPLFEWERNCGVEHASIS
jgi:hypothetical protein